MTRPRQTMAEATSLIKFSKVCLRELKEIESERLTVAALSYFVHAHDQSHTP